MATMNYSTGGSTTMAMMNYHKEGTATVERESGNLKILQGRYRDQRRGDKQPGKGSRATVNYCKGHAATRERKGRNQSVGVKQWPTTAREVS